MPSLIDCVELSSAVYDTKNRTEFMIDPRGQATGTCTIHAQHRDWRVDRRWGGRYGFQAASYRSDDGERILAYRGTDDLMDTLVDDVTIAVGAVPPQALAAIKLPASMSSKTILTGHSLGGALAIIAAAHSGLPAVTFNAPGVADSCVSTAVRSAFGGRLRQFLSMVARCAAGGRIVNIRIGADPVSSFLTTGMQTGSSVTLDAPHCGLDMRCRHAVQTCVQAVRKMADAHQPLKLQ